MGFWGSITPAATMGNNPVKAAVLMMEWIILSRVFESGRDN
jgi:hypothetical protein